MPMHLKIGSTVSRRPPIAPRLAPIYQAVKCLRRRGGQQQRRINEKSRRLPTFRPRPPSFTYSTSSLSSRLAPRRPSSCGSSELTQPRAYYGRALKFRNSPNGGGNFGRNRVRYLSPVPLSRMGAIAGASVVLGVKPAGR